MTGRENPGTYSMRSRQPDVPAVPLVLWPLVRLFAHIALCLVSVIRPVLDRERLIAAWPPQVPLWTWFERVWYAPLERWDVEYYVRIATRGYRANDGTMQFHPLYSLLAWPVVRLGADPLVVLTHLGFLLTLLLILAFYKLARLHLEPRDAQFAVLSFVLSPFAFAVLVPYTEALFLLCAVLCFYWASTNRWWFAGLAGALAVLTRQQGLFLLLPLGWMVWEEVVWRQRQVNRGLREGLGPQLSWLGVLGIPAAYAGWSLFRVFGLHDLPSDISTLHDMVYSVLISPKAFQVVAPQSFIWPWVAVARAWTKVTRAPDLDIVLNLVAALWFAVLLCLAWRHLRTSYRIYAVAIVLVSLSYHTGPLHPYKGLARHLLLGFPVFLGLGAWLTKAGLRLAIFGIAGTGSPGTDGFLRALCVGAVGYVPDRPTQCVGVA